MAPIAWAGGTLRLALRPRTGAGAGGRAISTWMGQPATAFAARRIAMALAVGLLLAFGLLTEFREVEQAPIIALNPDLAMWQLGAELGQPDLLALLIMMLAIVVGLARFAGDDLIGRIWVAVILLAATLPLALADLPLALPVAIGLLGLAASSGFKRTQDRIAISVPLITSAAILILGLSFLASGSFDASVSDYLAPLDGAAKLAMIGALLLGSFAIPGMPGRLAEGFEDESGSRVAILVAVSIANGYLASAASGLVGSPPLGPREPIRALGLGYVDPDASAGVALRKRGRPDRLLLESFADTAPVDGAGGGFHPRELVRAVRGAGRPFAVVPVLLERQRW